MKFKKYSRSGFQVQIKPFSLFLSFCNHELFNDIWIFKISAHFLPFNTPVFVIPGHQQNICRNKFFF